MSEPTPSVEELQETIKALRAQIDDLTEQLASLNQWTYGKRSEQIHSQQLPLDDEDVSVFFCPEHTGNQSDQAATAAKVPEQKKAKATRKEVLSKDIQTIETVIPCDENQCPKGHELTSVGKRLVRTELIVIPRRVFKQEIYEETKKCLECAKETGDEAFVSGHAPRPLIAHSLGSASMVATVAYNKYCLYVPLWRQKNEFKRDGINLPETTYANWMIKAAEVVKPVVDLIHQHLMSQQFLQGDETPFKALRDPRKPKPGTHGEMWVVRTIASNPEPAVYYQYDATRSGAFAKQLYESFEGVLQCDGYSGYNALKSPIKRVGCMAHVRRKFFKAAKNFTSGVPVQALGLIDAMFVLERQVQHATAAKRKAFRAEHIAPLMAKFWQLIDGLTTLPKGGLGRAVQYAQNQAEYLNRLLEYGEVDFSNNATERSVKSFVMGRKNFLFITSVAGAQANAAMMTLCESAKANGLDVFEYFKALFERVPQVPEFQQNEDTLSAFLPWNIKLD